MAIDRLLHVTSLYYGDAVTADEILRLETYRVSLIYLPS